MPNLGSSGRPRLRRIAAVAGISAGLVAGAVRPAHAAPAAPETKGPDGGAVPAPTGPLIFPPVPQPIILPPADAIGPFAAEIITTSAATERIGEQLKAVDEELAAANAVTVTLREEWQAAADELARVEARAAEVVTEAYQQALAMGPFEEYASELQDLSRIAPALPGQLPEAETPRERDSIANEVIAAEEAEGAARAVLDEAEAVLKEIVDRRSVLEEQFTRHQAALNTLVTRNASLLGQMETAREAYENSLAASRGFGTTVNGLQAAPAALAALQFALSQKGKPYRWAASGPSAYDCSGLMLAAYRTVGVRLTHRAAIQYGQGTPVLASQLLPGDLVFFSTDRSDWRQIHHVGMYMGNGRMVHAPNVGSVVKEGPIWWSSYFGATRLIPAIPVATPPAPPTPPPPTTPPPTTAPPTTTPPVTTTTTTTTTSTTTSTTSSTTTTPPVTTTTTTTTSVPTTTTTTTTMAATTSEPAASPTADPTATESPTPGMTSLSASTQPSAVTTSAALTRRSRWYGRRRSRRQD